MKPNMFSRISAAISGLLAIVIGLSLLLDPAGFYAAYEVSVPSGPNLSSDLRGVGAVLSACGIYISLSVYFTKYLNTALQLALLVYGAFVIGRVCSVVLDGEPSASIKFALLMECVVAALVLGAIWLQKRLTLKSLRLVETSA